MVSTGHFSVGYLVKLAKEEGWVSRPFEVKMAGLSLGSTMMTTLNLLRWNLN
jgi:hypothetical protein